MAKVYIVEFGYYKIMVEDKSQALDLLNATIVDFKYNEGIYTPCEDEITVKVVDKSIIRQLTKEEEENAKIRDLKQSNKFATDKNIQLAKEIEDLKCQIQALTKSEEVSDE